MNYAPFITQSDEECLCGAEMPRGTNAYCSNDGDLLCADCYASLEAKEDMIYEEQKELGLFNN